MRLDGASLLSADVVEELSDVFGGGFEHEADGVSHEGDIGAGGEALDEAGVGVLVLGQRFGEFVDDGLEAAVLELVFGGGPVGDLRIGQAHGPHEKDRIGRKCIGMLEAFGKLRPPRHPGQDDVGLLDIDDAFSHECAVGPGLVLGHEDVRQGHIAESIKHLVVFADDLGLPPARLELFVVKITHGGIVHFQFYIFNFRFFKLLSSPG